MLYTFKDSLQAYESKRTVCPFRVRASPAFQMVSIHSDTLYPKKKFRIRPIRMISFIWKKKNYMIYSFIIIV